MKQYALMSPLAVYMYAPPDDADNERTSVSNSVYSNWLVCVHTVSNTLSDISEWYGDLDDDLETYFIEKRKSMPVLTTDAGHTSPRLVSPRRRRHTLPTTVRV